MRAKNAHQRGWNISIEFRTWQEAFPFLAAAELLPGFMAGQMIALTRARHDDGRAYGWLTIVCREFVERERAAAIWAVASQALAELDRIEVFRA
jgi:hypothetical protein